MSTLPIEEPYEFVPLKGFEDRYEIMNVYPFHVRDKQLNTMNYGMYTKRNGCMICLKGKVYLLHRLIAKQFLPNPENKKNVSHINGNKLDNHLSNLCWGNRRHYRK